MLRCAIHIRERRHRIVVAVCRCVHGRGVRAFVSPRPPPPGVDRCPQGAHRRPISGKDAQRANERTTASGPHRGRDLSASPLRAAGPVDFGIASRRTCWSFRARPALLIVNRIWCTEICVDMIKTKVVRVKSERVGLCDIERVRERKKLNV